MKKFLLIMIAVAFTILVGNVYAEGENDMAGAMPPPLVYKTGAELKAEIGRLEAVAGGGEGVSGTRRRTWQEDFTLGVAYMHAGRLEEALTLIEKTIEARPSFTQAYGSLGMARFRLGDMEGAVTAWKRAIKADPRAIHIRRMMVIANDRMVLGKRVETLLGALGKSENKEWEPHLELARLYLKLRRADDSMMHIKKAIEIKGEDMTLLETLGRAHAGRGDFKGASVAFKKALKLAKAPPDQRRLQGMLADMRLFVKSRDGKVDSHKKGNVKKEK